MKYRALFSFKKNFNTKYRALFFFIFLHFNTKYRSLFFSSLQTGSLSSTNDPLNNEQSDIPIDCSRLLRANKVLQSKDYSQTLPMERPHTISSAYERSFARPIITSETYMPPDSSTLQQQGYRPQSTCSGSGTLSSASSSNPYAVPCIIPKRRQTQVGDCKTADIMRAHRLFQAKGAIVHRISNHCQSLRQLFQILELFQVNRQGFFCTTAVNNIE